MAEGKSLELPEFSCLRGTALIFNDNDAADKIDKSQQPSRKAWHREKK
jgi:hypothetical protein